MKRLFTIFISAALLASCFSCAKKETASQSVGADVQNTVKAEMPFKDISSDDIGEVFFALTRGGINYECTKSYTEADAINKTVDFLNNATVSSKNKYENNNVGNNPPYVVEFKDGNGDVLYSISFTDKFKEGYYCYFKNTSSDKQKEFFVDGEYLYPLIEHIAS